MKNNLCYMAQEYNQLNDKAKEIKVDYDRLEEEHERLKNEYETKAANLEVVMKESKDVSNRYFNCQAKLGEIRQKLEKELRRKGSQYKDRRK